MLCADTTKRDLRLAANFAVLVIGFTAFLTVLVWAYDLRIFYGLGTSMPMTLPSAIMFLLLAAAFLLAHTDCGLLKIFADDSLGGVLARRLLPAGVLVPTILGWLTRHGEEVGLYSAAMGEAAEVMGNILIFTALVCWCARGLSRVDLERKNAEALLRESEKRFSGAFLHSPIGTALVSPQGRWLKVNPALCKLVGYSEEELQARTFQDITHPDDLRIGVEKIRQMIAGEVVGFQVEKRYVHADGHIITVLLSTTLVRGEDGAPSHCVTQVQDISERKNAETEVLKSRRFLRSTLDALSSHIAILNEQGIILEVNEAWNHFARENGADQGHISVGGNYLAVCDAATDPRNEGGDGMAAGLRAIIAGKTQNVPAGIPVPWAEGKTLVRGTRHALRGQRRGAARRRAPGHHATQVRRGGTALEDRVPRSRGGFVTRRHPRRGPARQANPTQPAFRRTLEDSEASRRNAG